MRRLSTHSAHRVVFDRTTERGPARRSGAPRFLRACALLAHVVRGPMLKAVSPGCWARSRSPSLSWSPTRPARLVSGAPLLGSRFRADGDLPLGRDRQPTRADEQDEADGREDDRQRRLRSARRAESEVDDVETHHGEIQDEVHRREAWDGSGAGSCWLDLPSQSLLASALSRHPWWRSCNAGASRPCPPDEGIGRRVAPPAGGPQGPVEPPTWTCAEAGSRRQGTGDVSARDGAHRWRP